MSTGEPLCGLTVAPTMAATIAGRPRATRSMTGNHVETLWPRAHHHA